MSKTDTTNQADELPGGVKLELVTTKTAPEWKCPGCDGIQYGGWICRYCGASYPEGDKT